MKTDFIAGIIGVLVVITWIIYDYLRIKKIKAKSKINSRQTKPTDGEIEQPISSNLINASFKMDKTADTRKGYDGKLKSDYLLGKEMRKKK